MKKIRDLVLSNNEEIELILKLSNVVIKKSSSGDDYASGDNNNVDLSNYYDNIRPEDLLTQAGRNVSKSAQDLDNAMVSALQNGYGVQDACNIRLAEMAYKANAFVFDVAREITTFEVDV